MLTIFIEFQKSQMAGFTACSDSLQSFVMASFRFAPLVSRSIADKMETRRFFMTFYSMSLPASAGQAFLWRPPQFVLSYIANSKRSSLSGNVSQPLIPRYYMMCPKLPAASLHLSQGTLLRTCFFKPI